MKGFKRRDAVEKVQSVNALLYFLKICSPPQSRRPFAGINSPFPYPWTALGQCCTAMVVFNPFNPSLLQLLQLVPTSYISFIPLLRLIRILTRRGVSILLEVVGRGGGRGLSELLPLIGCRWALEVLPSVV